MSSAIIFGFADPTVWVSILRNKTVSGQWENRSTMVRKYFISLDDGRGSTISMCMCSKRCREISIRFVVRFACARLDAEDASTDFDDCDVFVCTFDLWIQRCQKWCSVWNEPTVKVYHVKKTTQLCGRFRFKKWWYTILVDEMTY